jgi:ribulose-5-phosphate 4-epimerase/fuculose-1-phosphate aldolase
MAAVAHGLLTVGRTAAEAFQNMYYLEQACRLLAARRLGRGLELKNVRKRARQV